MDLGEPGAGREFVDTQNGDTTLTDYGLYVIKDGQLVFDRVIKAQGG